MGRDYEPVKGQWYQNLEDQDSFRVLSVDEDAELVEVEYLDGDIEEMDLDGWHELDLDRIEEPEGWAAAEEGKAGKATEDDDDDDDWDEDDEDEDDDDDEDDDWDEDEDDDNRY